MGAAMRDDMPSKQRGMARVLEPLSCLAEPPTLPDECDSVMTTLARHHRDNPETVPYYFCSDITHG